MNHLLNWVGIPALNLQPAQRFYEALFGIELKDMSMGPGYKPSQGGALMYLNVEPPRQSKPSGAPIVGKAKIAAWLDSLRPICKVGRWPSALLIGRISRFIAIWAYEWGINRQLIEYPPPRSPRRMEEKCCSF